MTKRAQAKRDALATANLALVVSIARRIKKTLPGHFELLELVNEGVIGLLKAIDSHDPDTSPWNFWARTKIRGAILDSIGRRAADKHGHTANKYLENCRPSIDERFDEKRKGRCTDGGARRADDDPRNERERALASMAHQPTAPIAIDRARRSKLVSNAISWMPKDQATILLLLRADDTLWRADDKPNLRAVARLMGVSLSEAAHLHDLAVAGLRARLNGGAVPKAS